MKKIITTCLVLGALMTASAQLAKTRADNYFDDFAYVKAIELYEYHLTKNEDDNEAKLKLAESYTNLSNLEKAIEWYEKADLTSVESKHYLNYAKALSGVKEYEKSSVYYDKYQKAVGGDRRSAEHIKGFKNLNQYFKDSMMYEIENFEYNSPEPDFAPSFFADGIVFVSGRKRVQKVTNRTHSWDAKAFFDLYAYKENGVVVNYFDKEINTPYHEGRSYITKDSSKMFVSRNNFLNGKKAFSKEGINKIKVYVTEKQENGEWGEMVEFPFNSDEYSVGDPFFCEVENTLFFVSDKPGGFGDMDIYSSKLVDGKWEEPMNLGEKINSEGEERSPFITHKHQFFFASDGHEGLGGLDIYHGVHDVKSNRVSDIKNMGYPLNSSRDDFGLILKDNDIDGYFSSNRLGGKGSDDIYVLKMKEMPKSTVELIANVDVAELSEDSTVLVNIYDATTGAYVTQASFDKEGKALVDIPANTEYTYVVVDKDGNPLSYDDKKIEGTLTSGAPSTVSELVVVEPKPVVETGVVAVVEKQIPTETPNSEVENTDVGVVEQGESLDDYLEKLEKFEVDLKPGASYAMVMTDKGYLKNCLVLEKGTSLEDINMNNHPQNIQESLKGKVFRIDNVYFDLDKYAIRADAGKELDKVVAFMKQYPSILVELGSHTDVRASNAYNQQLSNKRAKSSRDYIVSKGISAERITWKGYGETRLVNNCKNGVACSEAQHQQNRRTEIKVTGVKVVSVKKGTNESTKAPAVSKKVIDCTVVKP